MVFADLFFIYLFLPLVLLCYYAARKLKKRNIILIVFSLIFYAWGEPTWVILLLFSSVFNWFMALRIGRNKDKPAGKMFMAISVIVDLALLFVFKYTGFFLETVNGITGASIPIPEIRLPIGISFFTFQAISYILDVYWETVEPQKKYYKFLLYLSLFPQLIAGPIVRYADVADELRHRRATAFDMRDGICRFILGLAKKVLIANNLYTIVDNFFGNSVSGMSMLGTWYVVIVYSMYVYFDFSGYSDMAIGMGRMFGFHFNENFTYPFCCQTIAQFWQRWHISLGSFFRDYLLYVPIFGKRRKYLSLFLVWFCTGLWHGASWNYIIWGLYFGFFIFFEQKLGKKKLRKWPLWWKHIYSKLVIIIGFGIFYFEDFGQLGQFFLNIFGVNVLRGRAAVADILTGTSLLNNLFLVILAVVFCLPVVPTLRAKVDGTSSEKVYLTGKVIGALCCGALLIISSILLVDSTNNPFLYWRF